MTLVRCLLVVGLALPGLAAPAAAQRPDPARPAVGARRDTLRARGDTLRRAGDTLRAPGDSARRDTALVQWIEPDSVMRELLGRQGYTKTRYQGGNLTFDAQSRGLDVTAGELRGVAVQRDSQVVVSDSSIRYDSQTRRVRVRSTPGGRIVLRDPTSGQGGDVVSRGGFVEYDLGGGTARISNAEFPVETGGETWLINADTGVVILPDSTARRLKSSAEFVMRGGRLTSCTDTTHTGGPHYHFAFRDLKRTGSNSLFARPAILYIYDVPVLWLPFVFQDMRRGRRSGILTPRFGLSDIVRNSPTYRRHIEDLGYYWAINQYMDANVGLDWRSGSGGDERGSDPGFLRFKAEWRYRWLDRFLNGEIATDHTRQRDGFENTAVSWRHSQEFSRNSQLTSQINYVTSTRLQQQNTFNPYATLATISSSVNYSHKFGPAQLALGGTRKQYPGREQVDQTLPTLSVTTGAIRIGEWLSWTPSFNFNESRTLNSDQAGASTLRFLFDPLNGRAQLDSLGQPLTERRLGNSRTTTASFETPLQLRGFDLRNSFRFSDIENDFPTTNRVYLDINDSLPVDRTFARTFRSELDWSPSFALPSFSQGRWNVSPSVTFTNVDPSPFAVRTELSGGRWVTQAKRPTLSLGVAPTFFGLIPGFGPFSRFRHAIQPTLSYGFAPKADVNDDFLRAIGRTRRGYLGSLAQNSLSLGFNTNLEGKIRSPGDTNPDAGEKLKLLSLQVTSLTYDFERARATGEGILGLTTSRFGYTIRSDLLPGVDFQADYSLFEGDPATSDTAVFKPYRERVGATFSLSRESNPFAVLARLFGRPVNRPATPGLGQRRPSPDEDTERRFANQPVAGSGRRTAQQLVVPPTKGWQASFTFSSARQRPLRGNANVIEADPYRVCEPQRARGQVFYDFCVAQIRSAGPAVEATLPRTTVGGRIVRQPPLTTLGASTSLAISRFWSASWQTTYDFTRSEFASHIVSLQRELHDWNAVFAFTQAPNGNFSFNFFIALKAQPELKVDYSRASYRQGGQRF